MWPGEPPRNGSQGRVSHPGLTIKSHSVLCEWLFNVPVGYKVLRIPIVDGVPGLGDGLCLRLAVRRRVTKGGVLWMS